MFTSISAHDPRTPFSLVDWYNILYPPSLYASCFVSQEIHSCTKCIQEHLLPPHNRTDVDSSGRLTNDKERNGDQISFTCNGSSQQLLSITDTQGRVTRLSYNSASKLTTITDPSGRTVRYTYDADNENLLSVTDMAGQTTVYTYQDGTHVFYPTGSTDAQGSSLAYAYDSPGNITTVKNVTSGGAGETTHSTYNSNGTIATMTDGNGNKSTYSYDSVGNLVTITPPSPLGATTLQHDALSRTTSLTNGKGQTTSYTYDALDRITKVTYADHSTISYVRDASGNVTSFTDTTGTTTFQYDATNCLTQKVIPGGHTLTYTYDTLGNALSFTDAGGTVTYSYNAVNLVTSLTDPNGAKTTYGYDNKNQRTSVNYPNGVVMSLTYDSAGHELSIIATHGSTTLSGYSYTYGLTDLRQNMTDQVTGLVSTYHYDSMNRLTQASTTANTFQYSYDKAGNRSSQTINGTTVTYSYNAANELTPTSAGVSYSYDGNGNLASISTENEVFVSNAKDQTTSIKNVPMTYTGPDQTERVQAGATTFVNAPFGISSQTTSSVTTFFTRESNGRLVSERTTTGTFYYLFDGLGSVIGLTDSSGNLVGNERYVYNPYGTILNTVSSTPMKNNPWRFGSGYFDGTSGLTTFGIRYDDTTTGRWTQHTPIGWPLLLQQKSYRKVSAHSPSRFFLTMPA